MIEESIASLEKRVDEMEERFNKLITTLSAGFGDTQANDLYAARTRVEMLEAQLSQSRQMQAERHTLIVELARILGVRGDKITTEALLRAAKRKAGK